MLQSEELEFNINGMYLRHTKTGMFFEVLLTIFDNRLGCHYIVFTDNIVDEQNNYEYFVETYRTIQDNKIKLFPLTEKQSESIFPILENEKGIYEPLEYFNFYT